MFDNNWVSLLHISSAERFERWQSKRAKCMQIHPSHPIPNHSPVKIQATCCVVFS